MATRLTFEDAQNAASRRGGECLSDNYVNVRTKMRWKCGRGHEWEATLAGLNKGRWCWQCRKLSLETAREAAASLGGDCLSAEYVSVFVQMRWRCGQGHEWDACFNNIRSKGTWCPTCAGVATGTLANCRAVAEALGGSCISQDYVNRRSPLQWRCADGHEWRTTFSSIAQGTWCPHCPNKRENESRQAFEQLTGLKFPKLRPKWLGGLELDGYCEAASLAFEHQGQQHYKYVPHFHRKGPHELRLQQARDQRKEVLCAENSVTLIAIPFTVKDIPKFVREALSKWARPVEPLAPADEVEPLAPADEVEPLAPADEVEPLAPADEVEPPTLTNAEVDEIIGW